MWTKLNSLLIPLYTRARLAREDGQALIEYTLILALVSIVALGVLTNVGNALVTKLTEVEGSL